MNLIQRTLATLGLAASLVGCGAATGMVRYEHGGLPYIVQHETGMSVPDMDHIQTERRAVNLGEDGRVPPGYELMGHLHEDGSVYERDDDGPRYDAVFWRADTNGDGNTDLFRMVVNTQVTTAPNVRSVGRSYNRQVILQDVDHDGNADRAWHDNKNEDGRRGYDGTYDSIERLNQPLQPLIDRLVWYARINQPAQTTQPTSETTDVSPYHVDQIRDL